MNRSFTVTTFWSPCINKDKQSKPDNEVWWLLAKDLRAGAKPGHTQTHTYTQKLKRSRNSVFTHLSTFHSANRLEAHTTINKVLRTKAIGRKVSDRLRRAKRVLTRVECAQAQAFKTQLRGERSVQTGLKEEKSVKQKKFKKSEASGIWHLVTPNSAPPEVRGHRRAAVAFWVGRFPPGWTHKCHICFKGQDRSETLSVLLGPASRRFLTQSVFQGVHHHCVDP